MANLTAIFGNSPDKPEKESEKLLDLYWNRAELKKEFADLRDEKYRLLDLLQQKDGAVARAEQKLEYLEHLLLDPDWVHSVVVYYQFRALNLSCENRLAGFAEELKQQREQRRHSLQVEDWNAAREAEAQAVEQQIGEQRRQVQMLEDQLQHERHRLATMNGLIRFLRRRSATTKLDEVAQAINSALENETSLLQQHEEIQNRLPPETEGLDIASKRVINFTILAFAQQLYLHFCEDGLAAMAHEASEKSAGGLSYGSKADCDELIERTQKRINSLDNAADLADLLQRRARLIAENARFRSDAEAIPVSSSVSTVYSIGESGKVSEKQVNLLGENYWNLAGILSR